jgi:hypothetical protein
MRRKNTLGCLALSVLFVAALVSGYFLYRKLTTDGTRSVKVLAWLRNPDAHQDWTVHAGKRCGDAPFIIPSDGFIGYLWDDSFRINHRHQGIDIFGGEEPGITPVYAAYAGYLTRLPDWKSSLIIRIPQDPLFPSVRSGPITHIWLMQMVFLSLFKNFPLAPVKSISKPERC